MAIPEATIPAVSGISPFSALEVVPENSLEAALFQIIDDISTAGDMFKPEIDNYFRFIQSKIELASKLIVSDGYKLYYTEQYKTRQA